VRASLPVLLLPDYQITMTLVVDASRWLAAASAAHMPFISRWPERAAAYLCFVAHRTCRLMLHTALLVAWKSCRRLHRQHTAPLEDGRVADSCMGSTLLPWWLGSMSPLQTYRQYALDHRRPTASWRLSLWSKILWWPYLQCVLLFTWLAVAPLLSLPAAYFSGAGCSTLTPY
jgi:hypothetical protein